MTSRNSSVTACSNSFLRQRENLSSNAVIKWFQIPVPSIPFYTRPQSEENESLGDLLRQQRSIIMSKWANGSQKIKRFLKSIMARTVWVIGMWSTTIPLNSPTQIMLWMMMIRNNLIYAMNARWLVSIHGSRTCHFCAARHLVLGLSTTFLYFSGRFIWTKWALFLVSDHWMAVADMIWEFVKMLIKLWN